MNTKNKNIILSIIVIFVGLLVAGGTYAFLTFSLNVTNGEYATGTECFNIEYNVNNGDGTQDITGTMFPSSGPSKGLNGKVSINVNSSCTMSGIGTLKLHVNDGTSSALSTKAAPRCVSHFTGLDMSEYTTESACTGAGEVWKYPDSYCEKADTLEVMKEYTTESTCTSNGGVWTTNGSPLKYAVYDSAGTSGNLLSSGHFDSGFVGTDVTLYDNFPVGTTVKNYYIYIWLDGNLTDNSFTELPFSGLINAEVAQLNLPSGYQRVEFIKSTGTQYINTEYPLWKDQNWKMEFKFDLSEFYNYNNMFGSVDQSNINNEIWIANDKKYYIRVGGIGKTAIATLSLNTPYIIVHDNTGNNLLNYVNGSLVSTLTKSNTSFNSNLSFGHRAGGQYLKGKIYYLKFWSNGQLVRDMIPCYNGSVGGLYDLISGKFYTSSGTNSFETGPSI